MDPINKLLIDLAAPPREPFLIGKKRSRQNDLGFVGPSAAAKAVAEGVTMNVCHQKCPNAPCTMLHLSRKRCALWSKNWRSRKRQGEPNLMKFVLKVP